MKPLTVAIVTPFSYQPFRSIWQLSGLLDKTLSAAGVESISVTPWSFLGDMTRNTPLHNAVSLFERLTLSGMALHWQLRRLHDRAKRQRRDFAVLLSDQSLGLLIPLLGDLPVYCVVNDLLAARRALGEFDTPEQSGKSRRALGYQKIILGGLRFAKGYLCPSQATASDLVRLGVAGKTPVTVAPFPTHTHFAPPPADQMNAAQALLWRKLGVLPQRYILNVGSAAWYKNRMGLIRAMGALKALTPTPPALVFAGEKPTQQETDLIESLKIDFYCFTGLDDTELATLYAGAEALVMPSLAEGFGWPALEALVCGTPIIISDSTALVESFGPAACAILAHPYEAKEAEWAVEAAKVFLDLMNITPEQREGLIAEGAAYAANFSTEAFSLRLCNVFKQ